MNGPPYQPRLNHPHSQENLFDLPSEDDMKPFRVAEILKNQKPVQTMTDNQLIEHCHNEWKLWMASLLELKKLREKEYASVNTFRQQDQKKPHSIPPSGPQGHHSFPPSSQSMMMPHQFYQPSYEETMRLQNMHYMRGNQPPQQRPPYISESRSFPFGYNSEMPQPGKGYGPMMGSRGQQNGDMGKGL